MSHMHIKSEPPSPTCGPRPSAIATRQITHDLYNGGALDSQVTDSQYIQGLGDQPIPRANDGATEAEAANTSFQSSGSSDTAYEQNFKLEIWASAHSQGDENPEYMAYKKRFESAPADEPMEDCHSPGSRPSTPDFLARYNELKTDTHPTHLLPSELRVIAAIRADKDAEIQQYLIREQEAYIGMCDEHNQLSIMEPLSSPFWSITVFHCLYNNVLFHCSEIIYHILLAPPHCRLCKETHSQSPVIGLQV
ncbi:hypothetical protein DFH06DRAFT_1337197 [Mycena polygramma]|nr:hypothetical protein DFH06DRAFT_1337197 [Mycena polygramma]